jgi:hypothetical protein
LSTWHDDTPKKIEPCPRDESAQISRRNQFTLIGPPPKIPRHRIYIEKDFLVRRAQAALTCDHRIRSAARSEFASLLLLLSFAPDDRAICSPGDSSAEFTKIQGADGRRIQDGEVACG